MGAFGARDVRLERRAEQMVADMMEQGSVVLKRLGGDRAGIVGIDRLLEHEDITPAAIAETFRERTLAACAGRRVVAAQDTSEVNFSGREARRRGLGPGGDGKAAGFFIHPLIAADADTGALLGLIDVQIWTRTEADGLGEPKESARWLAAATAATALVGRAASVVVVGDRENDIYGYFAGRPAGVELIVRAAQNRALAGGGSLFAADAHLTVLGEMLVAVPSRGPGDQGRTARVRLSAGRVAVARPGKMRVADGPASVALTLVTAIEIDPPAGATQLCWRLLTTLPGESLAAASEVVRFYRLRWRIEEVFRVLKKDGLDLEATQVVSAGRLFKLAAMALGAAVGIVQLRDARDGSSRPATDLIDAADLDAAAAIGASLEGKTPRQRNPWAKGTLPWLTWIVARLGGWDCYGRPPGLKTLAIGLRRLHAMLHGYSLARTAADV